MKEEYIREEYIDVQKFIKKAKKIVRDYINQTQNIGVVKQNIIIESLDTSFFNYKAVFTCDVLENNDRYVVEYKSYTNYFYLDIYNYKTTIEYSADDIKIGRDFTIELRED